MTKEGFPTASWALSGHLLGHPWAVKVPLADTKDECVLVYGCESLTLRQWAVPGNIRALCIKHRPDDTREDRDHQERCLIELLKMVTNAIILPEKPKRQPTAHGNALERRYRAMFEIMYPKDRAPWLVEHEAPRAMVLEDLEVEILADHGQRSRYLAPLDPKAMAASYVKDHTEGAGVAWERLAKEIDNGEHRVR